MLPILRKMQDRESRTRVYGILLMSSSVPYTCMELHGSLYCTNNQYPWMAIVLCNFKHIENVNTHTGLVVYSCSGITVIYTYMSSGVFISSQTLEDFIWTALKQTNEILLTYRLMPISSSLSSFSRFFLLVSIIVDVLRASLHEQLIISLQKTLDVWKHKTWAKIFPWVILSFFMR